MPGAERKAAGVQFGTEPLQITAAAAPRQQDTIVDRLDVRLEASRLLHLVLARTNAGFGDRSGRSAFGKILKPAFAQHLGDPIDPDARREPLAKLDLETSGEHVVALAAAPELQGLASGRIGHGVHDVEMRRPAPLSMFGDMPGSVGRNAELFLDHPQDVAEFLRT